MIDRYGRNIDYLRLSVTELCNLRCRYCMPEEGICKKEHSQIMTEEEMLLAVKAAASLGIKKVRITGGEPLVKKNILSICRGVSAVDGITDVALTTNGELLAAIATDLRNAGVQRINISLDTLNPEKYASMTRCGSLDRALNGLHAALDAGFQKVKINTVLIGGFNDDEIADLAALTLRFPVDVRFIEMMPMSADASFDCASYIPCAAVLDVLPNLRPLMQRDGVASLYRLPNALGSIGFITSVSEHFCGFCNRIRITADGFIKPCLHSAEEYALKGLDFEGMRAQLICAIENKPASHGVLDAEHISSAGRTMNRIGG